MKKIILFTLALFVITSLSAQCPINKGQAQLNTGLGLYSSGIPVYAGVDYGIHKDVTIGGEVSFRTYNNEWNNGHYRHTGIGVMFNGNYHFNHVLNIPLEWDFYAGANLGFFYWRSPNDYYGDEYANYGLGIQVGGRYYFNEKVGINLEFGGGNALSGGKIGVSFKF